jgi:hypothetical protein
VPIHRFVFRPKYSRRRCAQQLLVGKKPTTIAVPLARPRTASYELHTHGVKARGEEILRMADYIARPLTAAARPVTPHAEVGFEEATVRQAPTIHCHCRLGVRAHQEQSNSTVLINAFYTIILGLLVYLRSSLLPLPVARNVRSELWELVVIVVIRE